MMVLNFLTYYEELEVIPIEKTKTKFEPFQQQQFMIDQYEMIDNPQGWVADLKNRIISSETEGV